ncbi:hypothetical protein [Pantoea sp. UBA6567]|uniref:hypothetical protein n=1 Tax=Pantoea sp. UBA6567 TaxID=1947043 RepID=UPI00259843C6|nr:hypothetical protein [Pantoea sp. UBA6567]
MKEKIYTALKSLHKAYEDEAQQKLPKFGVPLGSILEEMGMPSDEVSHEIYQALEDLRDEGLIWDESTSNGGFGRVIGAGGDIAYSTGARIKLAR